MTKFKMEWHDDSYIDRVADNESEEFTNQEAHEAIQAQLDEEYGGVMKLEAVKFPHIGFPEIIFSIKDEYDIDDLLDALGVPGDEMSKELFYKEHQLKPLILILYQWLFIIDLN